MYEIYRKDLKALLAGNYDAVSNPHIFQLDQCYIEPTKEKVRLTTI